MMKILLISAYYYWNNFTFHPCACNLDYAKFKCHELWLLAERNKTSRANCATGS